MTIDIWTSSYLSDLTDENLQQFDEIVSKNVKNQNLTQEEKTILYNNLDLWLYSLRIMRRNVEYTLSHFKSNLRLGISELESDNADKKQIDSFISLQYSKRHNSLKFLNAVERKILYVKLLSREQADN